MQRFPSTTHYPLSSPYTAPKHETTMHLAVLEDVVALHDPAPMLEDEDAGLAVAKQDIAR
jgi:hypothetical protein